MYLKEVEIAGFKSFADKTNINLDNNITCVVGPNGSGKSNIVDAIRWVLGEQSIKSLRGDNGMSDVIFSGSKSRNPLNVASVMLTFDNSDNYLNMPYNNVSIKRRVYRTGENEYFLNGEKCRLKDITELFLDTGVGKSSFNIISQGEISKILSNSPFERRFVVEEAAGILKYKTRREEALRKLDKTENNILRVNDIINELKLRVDPLKEQSIKAEEYLNIKDKLKDVEVGLLVSEITSINHTYQDIKKKIENLNNEIISLNAKITNNKLEELKKDSLNLEKETSKLNELLLKLTQEEEALNGKRKIVIERSKYNASDVKVHENIILLQETKLSLNNDIHSLRKDIENLEQNLLVSSENIKTLINTLSDMKVKKDNLNKEYNIKQREYQENSNRISIIKNNLENNSLFNLNVKKVLSNPRLFGIHDAFGNILEVDDTYSKALEVIVSGSKNAIIVDNVEAAKYAIEFLKDNNLGRCTFFPIDTIKPKEIDQEAKDILDKELDYLGVLSSFVRYDNKYQNIVLNQLGNVILCKDIDSGHHLSNLIKNRYRIVTLDGEVINAGGSITGGSVNKGTSQVSLKNELNDLVLKNNNLESILKDLNKSINNQNSLIIDMEEEIYQVRSDYNKLNDEKDAFYLKLEKKEKELENTTLELDNLHNLKDNGLSKEEERINEEYYAKKAEKEMVIKNLGILSKKLENIKLEILNLEAEEKIYNSDLRDKEKLLKELEIKESKMDIKLDSNLEILNNDYEMTYEKAKEEFVLEIDDDEARALVNKYKNNLKLIGMVNISAISEYKEVNERYEFLTNQRDDLLKAKETLLSIIDEMDDVMKEDFKKTFELLKEEFKHVFQMLFKGGDATLELTLPDNILETGVEIIASPPGKKLKSINLLSGGEKTLTAISLLFAILNIRKVPFCIFDEIEAALDENNVDVFGHYLDNYKDKTQFLLITHKKRTMEYAKTLYGITMQESGVSKMVSVKLED